VEFVFFYQTLTEKVVFGKDGQIRPFLYYLQLSKDTEAMLSGSTNGSALFLKLFFHLH
jgi:hypothetical protein